MKRSPEAPALAARSDSWLLGHSAVAGRAAGPLQCSLILWCECWSRTSGCGLLPLALHCRPSSISAAPSTAACCRGHQRATPWRAALQGCHCRLPAAAPGLLTVGSWAGSSIGDLGGKRRSAASSVAGHCGGLPAAACGSPLTPLHHAASSVGPLSHAAVVMIW
jgi:hypothetical protein